MSTPTPETLARWRENRRRMERELQQGIDRLLDRAEGGSLASFAPDDHAIIFARALQVLTDAAGGNFDALRQLSLGSSAQTQSSAATVEHVRRPPSSQQGLAAADLEP
ncbi:hypothetical protein P43SY_011816 [Pythium insidiosum]|uniref:Uncharacterized protein n=1 Tax=Pythium insidiosum TaxID=114742 RepID=A0AAD5LPI9_PYTIN|nr:hypothetical protein P43SY_011816 [Pythium insidiosum]